MVRCGFCLYDVEDGWQGKTRRLVGRLPVGFVALRLDVDPHEKAAGRCDVEHEEEIKPRGDGAVGKALGLFAMSRTAVTACWHRSSSRSSVEGSDMGVESVE